MFHRKLPVRRVQQVCTLLCYRFHSFSQANSTTTLAKRVASRVLWLLSRSLVGLHVRRVPLVGLPHRKQARSAKLVLQVSLHLS